MERKNLLAARMKKHWTLEEAAEQLDVTVNTLNRWEKGKATPHPYNIGKLCEVYGVSQAELGFDDAEQTISEMPEDISLIMLVQSDLTMRLFATVFESKGYKEVQYRTRHLLEEYDTMSASNEKYLITRREALRRLAIFPFATSLPVSTVEIAMRRPVEEIITKCAAGIMACWELSKSTEKEDLVLAFHAASAYIAPLKDVIKNSSRYLEDAKNVLAQCYLFKMVLGWHMEGLEKAMEYARQAMVYSEETDDIALRATIHTQLSWLYYYTNKYSSKALDEIQNAAHLLKMSDKPLPPNLYSSVQSTLAIRQAMHGDRQQAITSLRLAHEHFFQPPVDRKFIYIDYEQASLILEDGMVHANMSLHQAALNSFAQLVDPNTLASKMPVAERVRVEVLNNQAMVLLKSPERDMEQVIKTWTVSIHEAIKLQSTQRFNEALVVYEMMQTAWPGEQCIEELRELIMP
jgi:transcriptional regulator with XRE-family HTH domain